LQEQAARQFGELPRYTIDEDGPEHAKRFSASVELAGRVWGAGEGRTKKEAEQAAARAAVRRLQRGSGGTTPEPAGTTRGGNHA
jgi:ribonuclease-3